MVECEHAKLNTEDATPVDPGEWEIELSYALTKSRRAFASSWGRTSRPYLRAESLGLGIGYGLIKNVAVDLALGYDSIYDRDADMLTARGWTDLEVGAKWRFYHDEQARLEIAWIPSLSLPTGGHEVTEDFFWLGNVLALTKDWGGRWTSNFDLGLSYAIGGHRDDARWALGANAALGYQLTDVIQPEVELNYGHEFNNGPDADLLAATVGCILCVHENVRVDLGVQQGLTGRNADMETTLLAGITFGF